MVKERFDIASYVSEDAEDRYSNARKLYFCNLFKIVESYRYDTAVKAVLDVGCSYGHLMDLFLVQDNYAVYDIEINEFLRKKLRDKDYKIFESLQNIMETKFDIILMIDCLYYFENQVDTINYVRENLNENGLLIIRVTNRAWLANLVTKTGFRVPYILMGDSKYPYTYKEMNILLGSNGFYVEKVIFKEKGKISHYSKIYFICNLWLYQQNGAIYICWNHLCC